jgi:hypothetical protein
MALDIGVNLRVTTHCSQRGKNIWRTCFPYGKNRQQMRKILQRAAPLLCYDREIGEHTTDVSRQRLGKHILAATNRRATKEVLLETGCSYVVRAESLP